MTDSDACAILTCVCALFPGTENLHCPWICYVLLVVSRCKTCSKTQTQVVVPLHIAFFLSFFPSFFLFFFFFFFCFLFLFYSFLFGWSQQSCIFLGCCLDHCVWHWPLWLQKLGRKKSQWLALLVPYQIKTETCWWLVYQMHQMWQMTGAIMNKMQSLTSIISAVTMSNSSSFHCFYYSHRHICTVSINYRSFYHHHYTSCYHHHH